jgi:class 3 adenylate cyclase
MRHCTPPVPGERRWAGRAIRCALAIHEAMRELDLEVRIGLHAGECEVLDGKVAGIAVSIGARVSALAAPGQVLVSQTVKDLVAGSGIAFEDHGVQELKGVPGNGGCTPSQTRSRTMQQAAIDCSPQPVLN